MPVMRHRSSSATRWGSEGAETEHFFFFTVRGQGVVVVALGGGGGSLVGEGGEEVVLGDVGGEGVGVLCMQYRRESEEGGVKGW